LPRPWTRKQEQVDARTDQTAGLPGGNPEGASAVGTDRAGDMQSLDAGLAGTGEEADRDGRVPDGAEAAGRVGDGRDRGEHGQLAERNGEGAAGRSQPRGLVFLLSRTPLA